MLCTLRYDSYIVRTLRAFFICTAISLSVIPASAQIRRQVEAPAADNRDFSSKFFDDLRSLFGKLQRSELEQAFRRAKPIRCSDLAGQSGEWKEVAFLNDDRTLGDWHFESIEDVKRDITAFVFSGTCRGEQGPLKVATSFPVKETMEKFEAGRIPFSQIVIVDNDPVSVIFDAASEAYTFELPYVYAERKNSTGGTYTLIPPLTTSRPERNEAIEFRCKTLSDAELTYRFLLCRTRLVDRDVRTQRQDVKQPLGNAAYYILSDGKEASSSVKLVFGDADTAKPAPSTARPTDDAPAPTEPAKASAEPAWQPAPSQSRLIDIGQSQIRLRFDGPAWNAARISKTQLVVDGMVSDFVTGSAPRSKDYCVWRPGPSQTSLLLDRSAADSILYWVEFRKDAATSAVFEMENTNRAHLGTLQCYFPQSQSPADITVDRWLSIAGRNIAIEVRK
jgi:hypothetical protein